MKDFSMAASLDPLKTTTGNLSAESSLSPVSSTPGLDSGGKVKRPQKPINPEKLVEVHSVQDTKKRLFEKLKSADQKPILFFASSNKSKIRDIKKLLFDISKRKKQAPELLIVKDIFKDFNPAEPHDTRFANAIIKADEAALKLRRFLIAENFNVNDPHMNFYLNIVKRLFELSSVLDMYDPYGVPIILDGDVSELAKIWVDLKDGHKDFKDLDRELKAKLADDLIQGGGLMKLYFRIFSKLCSVIVAMRSEEPVSILKCLREDMRLALNVFQSWQSKYEDTLKAASLRAFKMMEGHYVMADDSTAFIPSLPKFDHDPIITARLIKDSSELPELKLHRLSLLAELDKMKEYEDRLMYLKLKSDESNPGRPKELIERDITVATEAIKALQNKSLDLSGSKPRSSVHLQFLVKETDRKVDSICATLFNLYSYEPYTKATGNEKFIDHLLVSKDDFKKMDKPDVYVPEFEMKVQRKVKGFKEYIASFEEHLEKSKSVFKKRYYESKAKGFIASLSADYEKKLRHIVYNFKKINIPATTVLYEMSGKSRFLKEADSDYPGYLIGVKKLNEVLDKGFLRAIEQVYLPLSQQAGPAKTSWEIDEEAGDRGKTSQYKAYEEVFQKAMIHE